MKFTAIIDRIENDNCAVLEIAKRGNVVLPLDILPKGSVPGTALDITIKRNKPYEKDRRESIIGLQSKLLRNKK